VKLFEFESLEEGVRRVLNVGGVAVLLNDHLYDQAAARNISFNDINALIKKIPQHKKKLQPLGGNEKFYLWSNLLKMGIGLRKRDDKDGYMRVEVMTAVVKQFDGEESVFVVG
jgi:hypothetical protein